MANEQTNTTGFKLLRGDKVLWVILAALAIISILVVYSSSAKMGFSISDTRSVTDLLRSQLIIVGICAVTLILLHYVRCRFYGRIAWLNYWVWWVMTFAAYFFGDAVNDANRWIFGIQPNEGLKIATVIVLARQLAARQSIIGNLRLLPTLNPKKLFKEQANKRMLREHTIPIMLPVAASCLVILPAHTSAAIIVFVISLIMMYVGRVRRAELLKVIMVVGVIAVVGLGMLSLLRAGRTDTAGGRVSVWKQTLLESRMDVEARQLTDTERSMIAIHQGGLFGKGAGQSSVRVELTHPECDYTFAFFVEEYGLFMALIVMSFYLWIVVRGITIFKQCETAFPGLMVLGLVMVVTLQAMMHILVSVNFFPETGQTLPFISRGGSSMFFATVAMAIVLGVSRQNEERSHDTPRNESMLER